MKTIKELSPTWSKIVEENESIPDVIDEIVNGISSAHIGDPRCCFVGEARGGGCYYDKFIRVESRKINTDGTYLMKENPDYCNQCSGMSMEFFYLSEDGMDETKYKELCKRYEEHYNESHNGDKCK